MADIYVTAAAAQRLCDKAQAAIEKPQKASGFGYSIEMQASSPEQVLAAIAHVKDQYGTAKALVSDEEIVIRIQSHHAAAFAWALSKQ